MNIKRIISVILMVVVPGLILAQDKESIAIHPENKNRKLDSTDGQLLVQSNRLTLKAAYALTEAARSTAKAMRKQVSIAIVDQSGVTILLSRGDEVGPHNTEAARRKAYTAVSTKKNTLTLARNAKTSADSENLAYLPELLLLGGGIPLWHKGEIIGAIGVAGGGGAENDHLIANSANSQITQIDREL